MRGRALLRSGHGTLLESGSFHTGREDDPTAFYPEGVSEDCFRPGKYGGPCIRDDWPGYDRSWLSLTQACYEEKVAAGSTAESLDIVGECLCEDLDPGRDCRGALDQNPGDDGRSSNFIACLLWPLEGDGDAGASETPSVSPCAEICFPGWH